MDLGIRLRDLLYRRALVEGPVRNAFLNRVTEASRDPHSMLMAMPAIENLLDTWPLAHLVDDARNRWIQGADGTALAVLSRAARLVSAVLGYPVVIDGRWPMPDVEWIEQQVGPGPHAVVHRGFKDGAPAMAVVLRASHSGHEPVELPNLLVTHGDTFADDLPGLLQSLQSGAAAAVRFETPHDYGDAAMAGIEQLRAAAPAQLAFDRYGHAGLLAPDAPAWDDLLRDAPAGDMGEVLLRTCDALVLPTLNEDGKVEAFAAVVWDAPYRPLRLIPGAGELLRRLDGTKDIATIAQEVSAPEATVRNLYEQLAGLGACTAV